TAMSSIRPPMLAGPMERNRNGARSGSVDGLIIGARAGAGGPPWASSPEAATGRASAMRLHGRRDERSMTRSCGGVVGWFREDLLATPHVRCEDLPEPFGVARLGAVVVEPRLPAAAPLFLRAESGQGDQPKAPVDRVGPNLRCHLVAIHLRHAEIEKH